MRIVLVSMQLHVEGERVAYCVKSEVLGYVGVRV